MADSGIYAKFRDFIMRAREHSRGASPSQNYSDLMRTSSDHTHTLNYPSTSSGFVPHEHYIPNQTAMVVLRDDELSRGFSPTPHIDPTHGPQLVKNNPKIEEPSSLKKQDNKRMKRKLDSKDR